jgi:hypothetical protein
LHQPLCSLCLSSTRLAGDDDALVLHVCFHVIVTRFRDSKDVRWDFQSIFRTVGFQHLVNVYSHCESIRSAPCSEAEQHGTAPTVPKRIDRYKHMANVCLQNHESLFNTSTQPIPPETPT